MDPEKKTADGLLSSFKSKALIKAPVFREIDKVKDVPVRALTERQAHLAGIKDAVTHTGSAYTVRQGLTPRIQDFYLIKTKPDPQAFLDFLCKEIFGNYEAISGQCGADFGMIVMEHRGMILAKFDAGPWSWYDSASQGIIAGIVHRANCRAWVCGWAIEKAWSWVEAWRPDRKTGEAKLTETIDGPSDAGVTPKARERWGIGVREAFDDLHRAAQWEALRQWLIAPADKKPSRVAVSHLAGNLIIAHSDHEWIPAKWAELFPGRRPEDGPLHLHRYFRPLPAIKDVTKKTEALTFRPGPPAPGIGGENASEPGAEPRL